MFEAVIREIDCFEKIVIQRHAKPDGDAIGSQVGLLALIRENFPNKDVHIVGDAPGRYGFMEGSAPEEVPDAFFGDALVIILDCGGANMVSDDRRLLAPRTVRIDHHLFSGRFADVEVIDSSFESCCGMIAELAREQMLRLTPLAAKSLFTGMVTDSGRFRYDSTSARTFALASFLMETPFSTEDVYKNLYSESLRSVQLRAAYTQKITVSSSGTAYVYCTREEAASFGGDPFSVSRGFVNTMADLTGIPIWVSFTESEEGVLCELRSAGPNINPVAVRFGGGGHAKASGATVPDRETAMEMLAALDELAKEYLGK